MKPRLVSVLLLSAGLLASALAQLSPSPAASIPEKKPLTLDEYFNYVSISGVKMSPDGRAVVVETTRSDWDHNRYRKDLWIWREATGALDPLTQSGHDSSAEWSADGKWVAFLSDRKPASDIGPKAEADKDESGPHVYVISAGGGEAFAVTRGGEAVHAFAWSADSRSLFFATRRSWSAEQKETHEKEWHDVERCREDERGDVICRIALADAVRLATDVDAESPEPIGEKAAIDPPLQPGAKWVASIPRRVWELAPSPDGRWLAFNTESVSLRSESIDVNEVFLLNLSAAKTEPRQITKNEAFEERLAWQPDSSNLMFFVMWGSMEGKYEVTQGRFYSYNVATGGLQRWAMDCPGAGGFLFPPFQITKAGGLLISAHIGTEQPLFHQDRFDAPTGKLPVRTGSYFQPSAAKSSSRVAFVYSALDQPEEVYLADEPNKVGQAKAITSFNRPLLDRAMPEGRPYQWMGSDGTSIEGMLVYPPGKREAKKLKTLVLLHGGPMLVCGNRFGGTWSDDWSPVAMSEGWLVFLPNYRGSIGYGDAFMRDYIPQIVSRPSRDILSGVDALVRDGIADPEHLAIGGYSFGGYLTNWIITQTTRFKAAFSGAGAVEHAANWGMSEGPFGWSYALGGRPWENQKAYSDEAALFHLNKVTTPTLILTGANDIRVPTGQCLLLERALHSLGVPSSLLVFPGEGHLFESNPWHWKILVREELKWIERYAGAGAGGKSSADEVMPAPRQ